MPVESELIARAESKCELCSSTAGLGTYTVPPRAGDTAHECVLTCETCREQMKNAADTGAHHWRCLGDSMWNPCPAVQVVAWRLLTRLQTESWSQDLLEMLYLDDETLAWAQETGDAETDPVVVHVDSNGAVLEAGDTVTLIKDLVVKGANFTAKRGTAVRGIALVDNNPDHIEGRVSGQHIVILTKFVKKS